MIKWSYSGLKDYINCPRQYYEVKVAKNFVKRPTEQMLYGNAVHSALEHYVKDGEPLKKNYERYQPMLDALLDINGDRLPEYRMAINTELKPCTWAAEDYWVRGIVDLLIIDGSTAHIVDYKTGSVKYPDVKQLRLMSLLTYAHYPQIDQIKAGLLFVAHNTFINEEYRRDQSETMWKDFLPDLERLKLSYEHDKWPENPNPLCGWCPVTACQFNKGR